LSPLCLRTKLSPFGIASQDGLEAVGTNDLELVVGRAWRSGTGGLCSKGVLGIERGVAHVSATGRGHDGRRVEVDGVVQPGRGGAGRDYAGVDMDASTTRLVCDSRAAGMEVEVRGDGGSRMPGRPSSTPRHVLGAASR
jgi:hypothetical protein